MQSVNRCPICGQEVGVYHEVTFKEPYTHNNPYDGIMIYGAYSSPKETICFENNYLHFAFYNSENNFVDHRLIKLGVEVPAAENQSVAFVESGEDGYDDWDDDEEYYDPFEDDDDTEEFPNGSLDY